MKNLLLKNSNFIEFIKKLRAYAEFQGINYDELIDGVSNVMKNNNLKPHKKLTQKEIDNLVQDDMQAFPIKNNEKINIT